MNMNFDFLNSNGLVNGNIPADRPCPWINDCGARNERCPGIEAGPPDGLIRLSSVEFSCALSRLYSMGSFTDPSMRRGTTVSDMDEQEFKESIQELSESNLSVEQLTELLKDTSAKIEEQRKMVKQLRMFTEQD